MIAARIKTAIKYEIILKNLFGLMLNMVGEIGLIFFKNTDTKIEVTITGAKCCKGQDVTADNVIPDKLIKAM